MYPESSKKPDSIYTEPNEIKPIIVNWHYLVGSAYGGRNGI